MNALAVKTALRYVIGWGLIAFFAALLTFIFSFLGAFFCAGLTGMMLGSFKLPRWQTIALSFIFPAVLFLILRTGGAELLMRQVILLSVLCLGTFWLTYLLVHAVVRYERKDAQLAAGSPVISRSVVRQSPDLSAGKDFYPNCLTLQVLQGKWSCITRPVDLPREHKSMEIERERLLLTISDSMGKISFKGRGEVKICEGGILGVSGRMPVPDDTLVCI